MVNSAIQRFTQSLMKRLSVPLGTSNQILGVDEQGRFKSNPLIKEVPIVTNQTELEQQKGNNESFDRVFNSWQRISRRGTGNWSNRVNLEELETWEYDTSKDSLRCTFNTNSMVGFISPESSDDFDFEVILSSDSGDDDTIGLMIAFAPDDLGRDHTLSVFRVFNKTNKTFRVIQDYVPNYTVVAQGHDDLVLLNGKTFSQQDTEYFNGGWGGWKDYPNGILLKVIRRGDDITVKTGQPGSDHYYEPATMSFNLNDTPELSVFKGPQRFGYMCLSQEGSTWTTIQRPKTRKFIVDLTNTPETIEPDGTVKIWEITNNQWEYNNITVQQLINRGILNSSWLHFNATTGRYFMVDYNSKLFRDTSFQ